MKGDVESTVTAFDDSVVPNEVILAPTHAT